MVAVGENVIMQTALVTVENKQREQWKTRTLLDTGSTRTYITEDLANSLKLKPTEKDTFSVYAFGSTKPKERTSSIFEVKLKTLFGKDITTCTNRASETKAVVAIHLS